MLLPVFRSHFPSEGAFHLAVDKFEVMAVLSYAIPAVEKGEHYWTLTEAYGWRVDNRQRVFAEIRANLPTLGMPLPS